MIWIDWIRAFALGSSSLGTSRGVQVCAARSDITPAVPTSSAAAISSGTDSMSCQAATISASTSAVRTAPAHSITVGGPNRSTRTPPSRPNSSQGSRVAVATSATSDGDRVTASASSGTPKRYRPSPASEHNTPLWNTVNRRPSPRRAVPVAAVFCAVVSFTALSLPSLLV